MSGRWPANVIMSPEMARALDSQSGVTKSPTGPVKQGGRVAHGGKFGGDVSGNPVRNGVGIGYGDEGGASRFFLTAGYEPWELEWIIANGLAPCGT